MNDLPAWVTFTLTAIWILSIGRYCAAYYNTARDRLLSEHRGRAAVRSRDLHVRVGTACWRCGGRHETPESWELCARLWPFKAHLRMWAEREVRGHG